MSSHIPLVLGNWKLNPTSSAEAKALFVGIRKKLKKDWPVQVVIAAPFPFIPDLTRLSPSGRLPLAAQDVFYEESGAHTGEVSPAMLASFGVTHVIIGHSERRARGESNEEVGKKVRAALHRKMTPVVCIGESVRDNKGDFYIFIEDQLRSLAEGLTARQISQIVIAYEPVWAIGTGKTPAPEDVEEMQLFIRAMLTKLYDRGVGKRARIIYGGSVTKDNAPSLYHGTGVQGFLVGSASLKADDFIAITRAVL